MPIEKRPVDQGPRNFDDRINEVLLYVIMGLRLQIGRGACKVVTLLLLMAFGQSIGQVDVVSNNDGHLFKETMLSFITHVHQYCTSGPNL